jgi:hypothetical protein
MPIWNHSGKRAFRFQARLSEETSFKNAQNPKELSMTRNLAKAHFDKAIAQLKGVGAKFNVLRAKAAQALAEIRIALLQPSAPVIVRKGE